MWLLKKTKQSLTRNTQPFQDTPQFKQIQQLLKIEGNVLPINKLQSIAQITFDQEKCQEIYEILENKMERYFNKKSKMIKMFKLLVIIDYLLLNGASAFVDLFQDSITRFDKLSVSCLDGNPNFSTKDQQTNEIVTMKAAHIVLILKDKEKRLAEKLKLNQAKLLLRKDKAIQGNNFQQSVVVETDQLDPNTNNESSNYFFKKRPKAFQKVQKFMSKKLVKLTSALLGLIDPDYEISDDYLKNRQFMQRGQSIIQQFQNNQGEENKGGQQFKKQDQIKSTRVEKIVKIETKTKQQIAEDQRVRKMQEQIKKNQNLLELQHQFL